MVPNPLAHHEQLGKRSVVCNPSKSSLYGIVLVTVPATKNWLGVNEVLPPPGLVQVATA